MARNPFPPSRILLRFSWGGRTPCAHCGVTLWFHERDTWNADHLHGNDDNSDANLQILCIDCHEKKTVTTAFGARTASPPHQQTASTTAAANAIYEASLRPPPIAPRKPLFPLPVPPPPRAKPALTPMQTHAIAFGAAYALNEKHKLAPLPPPRATPPPALNDAARAGIIAAIMAASKRP